MNNQISIRQTACFCVISMLGLKLIELPSLLFVNASSSGLIVGLILFLFDFLLLYIFLKAKQKYKDKSLYEILEMCFGKAISKIVYIMLFVFYILKLSVLINQGVSYMKSIVDEDYTTPLFLITFIPVISCAAYNGVKCFARTTEFGYIFIIIGLVLCLLLSDISTVFGDFGPIFEQPFSVIMKASFDLSFYFSDFLFIAILSDKIQLIKNYKKTIFLYSIAIFIILSILFYVYFKLYRGTAFLHKNAIEDITQYTRNIGNVGNTDIISILVYLFILFLQGGLYMNCLCVIYEKIFNYKKTIYSLISVDLIIILLNYFVIFNLSKTTKLVVEYFKFSSILVMIIIPLIYVYLLIFDRRKNDKKEYKKNNKISI